MANTNHSKHVLVIGAGIVGLSAAYALQKQNYRITLIGPNDISERASSAAACLIGGSAVIPWASTDLWSQIPSMLINPKSPLKLSIPFPADLFTFFIASHRAGRSAVRAESSAGLAELGLTGLNSWMTLLEDLPEAIDLFRQTGCYFLYTQPSHKDADKHNGEVRERFGMALEEHDEEELSALMPDLACPGATSTNVVNAAHVRDPVKLQLFLRAAIVANGGSIINALVTDFITIGSRVTAVITDGESYEPDAVVIAAGYGSKLLAKKLNSTFPLLPCRGYSVTLPNATVSLDTPLLVLSDGYAVTPTDNGLRIAGLVSIGGNVAKQQASATDLLIANAESLFGQLDTSGKLVSTGIRPLTPDSLPVIDQSPNFENAYFNFGHGHWGLTQAASSANLLIQLLKSTETPIENNRFRSERFRKVKT